MKVAITGATGFIGKALAAALVARGDQVVALCRSPERARAALPVGVECVAWEVRSAGGPWELPLCAADAVVHLAGEPIMGERWTEAFKARIVHSRVQGTRNLVDAISRGTRRPKVFVSASGVDYYGDTGDDPKDETGAVGNGFLSDVCVAWEAEAARAATLGVREVRLRIGVVLGEGGGALERMEQAFRWFVGGPVGSGGQWFPWIHKVDAVAVILHALDSPDLSGPVNAVAPAQVRMGEFARELGRAMGRPSWASVPTFALRMVLGEAGGIVAESKRVVPRVLERRGFVWKYPELDLALRSLYGQPKRSGTAA